MASTRQYTGSTRRSLVIMRGCCCVALAISASSSDGGSARCAGFTAAALALGVGGRRPSLPSPSSSSSSIGSGLHVRAVRAAPAAAHASLGDACAPGRGSRRPSSRRESSVFGPTLTTTTLAAKGGGAKTAAALDGGETTDDRVDQEPCNVVFTHSNADFDSLAAAVALALLWRHEQPDIPSHVVLPRGAHPVAQRFLAFHKHLLPLRGFKTIMAEDVRAVGVVDAQSASRIGRGQAWLDSARSIHVFDHHEGDPNEGDAKKKAEGAPATLVDRATELVIEKVGSTTTLLVERLQEAGIVPAPHEATLFVLGIRADTGGLVYEGTTVRDAAALLWCLENGASQVAISEFGVARVSEEQRAVMNQSLRETVTRTVGGQRVSTVLVTLKDQYVAGLAQVCEELLELTDSDVFLLGATHRSGGGGGGKKKKKKSNNNGGGGGAQWISLIGRCSARAIGVDLNAVMRSLGGGGHPKAAAAALRCGEPPEEGTETTATTRELPLEERLALANAGTLTAEDALETAVDMVEGQIPEQLVASSFMVPVNRLVTMSADETVGEARLRFDANGLKSAPVIDADTGKFRGSLKLNDLVKANRAGRSDDKLRGMMRLNVETVLPDSPMAEVEELLVDKGVGRLPVVDDDGQLVGIVTRTDVLRQHKLYDEDSLDLDLRVPGKE